MSPRLEGADLVRLSKWLATPPQILPLRKLQHLTFLFVLARGLVGLVRLLQRLLWVARPIETSEVRRNVVVQVEELQTSSADCTIPYLGMTSREILSKAKDYAVPLSRPVVNNGHLEGLKELQAKLFELYEIQGLESGAGDLFKQEVVAMAAKLLHGSSTTVTGVLTKDASESTFLAVLAYKMMARDRGIEFPNIISADLQSQSLSEACAHFGIKLVEVETMGNEGATGRLDIGAVERQISDQTIGIFARCPCAQLGTFDSIADLGALALKHRVGLHCDATTSGFLLCGLKAAQIFKEKFDFEVDGVTSVCIDSKHLKNVSMFLTKELRIYVPPNMHAKHSLGELGKRYLCG